jgi:hypothetical protein
VPQLLDANEESRYVASGTVVSSPSIASLLLPP